MGKETVYIKDWGWISCSNLNIRWEFDRSHLKIRTGAINLRIPEEFVKIKKGKEDV